MIILSIWGWLFPYKTKAERKEIYKKLVPLFETTLKIIEDSKMESYGVGFCSHLKSVTRIDFQKRLWKLPELYAWQPSSIPDDGYWFPLDKCGHTKRLKILEQIIK